MIKQSRRKMFNLTVSEWEGNYPEHGSETYILRSTYFANAFNRIKYESIKELSIKILDVEDGFGERLVNIITKHLQQKINGSTSSSSDILEKISSVYEDLFIKLSYNGELISVENFSLVQKKWRKIKKVILESYRGQSIRILIRNMDKNISSEEVFIQFIKKDSHLGLGLKNIYGKYDSLSSIKAAKKS